MAKKKTTKRITPKQFEKMTWGMSFLERTQFIKKNKKNFGG